MAKSPNWMFFERTVKLSWFDCEVKVPFTLVPLAIFKEGMKRRLSVCVSFRFNFT